MSLTATQNWSVPMSLTMLGHVAQNWSVPMLGHVVGTSSLRDGAAARHIFLLSSLAKR